MPDLSALKDRSPRWVKDVANVTTRTWARATVGDRPAPDFLIIGCKRGGTTSLFNYLLMHPGVLGLYPESRGKKSTDYFFKELPRGEEWYRSHFHTEKQRARMQATLGHRPQSGEASPYYMWDHRIAAEVHAVAPEVKAIALLRDPVERAWSHYHERRKQGVEPLSFTDALAAESSRLAGEAERMAADRTYYSEPHDWYTYRARGIYLPSLENWWAQFGRENLLVLRAEDLYSDVQGTFDTVCEFLGLPQHQLPDTSAFNGITPSRIPEDVRAELAAYYAPFNAELEEALGRPLGWTTV